MQANPNLRRPSTIEGLIKIHPLKVNTSDSSISFAKDAPSDIPQSTLTTLSQIAKHLKSFPPPHIPPPPAPQPNQRSTQVTKAREDGNVHYRNKNFAEAERLYTLSAELAASRPLFEASIIMREELSVAVCNRCAAYMGAGKLEEALADAETTIKLRRNWTKAHFRKGKVLDMMGRFADAREALLLGLEYDPSDVALVGALAEIDKKIREQGPST